MSKAYPFWLKAIAAAAALAAPLFLTVMAGSLISINNHYEYSEFYDWEIIDGETEKIGENVYRVTLTLKNHSAYRFTLQNYDIQVNCNGKRIDKNNSSMHDSYVLEALKAPILPAGQTTEYSFDITLPPNAEYIELEYYGASFSRREYLNMDEFQRRLYLLELD